MYMTVMTIPLSSFLGEDWLFYPVEPGPPADYFSSRRIRPLRAAKFYGPNFIPNRHTWSDFNENHFRKHLGHRLLQFPCPMPPRPPLRIHSSCSVDDVKEVLRPAMFELINMALQVVFRPPFVFLLYAWIPFVDKPKLSDIYQTIPPTHVMWDDLYESLPDDLTVPGWSQLSVEEKGKALVRMLPRIAQYNASDIDVGSLKRDQAVTTELDQDSDFTPVDQEFRALRHFAYLQRGGKPLYRIVERAFEEQDIEIIAYLLRVVVPLVEIIPFIAPYTNTNDVDRTTKQLKSAFARGEIRSTLSVLEPRWEKFCQAKTDAEALIQMLVQLPPAFPELLPEHSELQSVDHDQVIIAFGHRAGCVPGFQPDGACVSTQCLKLEAKERVNRVPGAIGFTWDFDMLQNPDNPVALSAMAKVYTYSNQHNTRYGYLLTNNSLAVFRRCEKEPGIPRNGHIEMSKIFWVGCNAYLPLFYLHLLASHPTKWKLQSSLWKGSSRLFDIHDEGSFNDP